MAKTLYRHKLVQRLLAKRHKPEGFTLVELLIVVVILGVLGAIGIPAYLNQVDIARENSAEQAVMAAAKSCAALQVTGDTESYEPPSLDVTGNCNEGESTFTVSNAEGSAFEDLDTPPVATVSEAGGVTLTTEAEAG